MMFSITTVTLCTMSSVVLTNSAMVFFFFKQKTAYEMRIGDWSSDVCSSDLCQRKRCRLDSAIFENDRERIGIEANRHIELPSPRHASTPGLGIEGNKSSGIINRKPCCHCYSADARSEVRRVGKECVSTFISRC